MTGIKALVTDLYDAISNSEAERAIALIKQNPNLLEEETPIGSWLHVAARHGDICIVTFLIQSGLGINHYGGTSGSTPLNFAVSAGHIDIAKYLLDNGAIIDNSEPERNPLFSAIHKGHFEIVKLLVENYLNIVYGYDLTKAISFADECGRKKMVVYLKSVGKNE